MAQESNPQEETEEAVLVNQYKELGEKLLSGQTSLDQFASLMAKKEQELKSLADHDGLIKSFLNNHGFMIALQREIQNSKRFNIPCVLCAIDVDKFKQFNDSQGHPAGDLLLKLFAQVVEEHIRLNDLKGRVGGDEFLLLLIGTNLNNAQAIMERIQQKIIDQTEETFPNFPLQTISVGLTQVRDDDTIDSVRQRADEALYQAKETRGQTVIK